MRFAADRIYQGKAGQAAFMHVYGKSLRIFMIGSKQESFWQNKEVG